MNELPVNPSAVADAGAVFGYFLVFFTVGGAILMTAALIRLLRDVLVGVAKFFGITIK